MVSTVARRSALCAGLVLALCSPGRAAVTFTGTVSPGSPGEVGPNDVVIVGSLDSSGPSVDPRGAVLVDGDSTFEARELYVGRGDLALASVRFRVLKRGWLCNRSALESEALASSRLATVLGLKSAISLSKKAILRSVASATTRFSYPSAKYRLRVSPPYYELPPT